jgi:hypothetical protein
VGSLPWGRSTLNEVFMLHEASPRRFWNRATFGVVDLTFEVVTPTYWPFETYTQADAQGSGGRNRTLHAGRQLLKENGISLDGYDHFIAIVPPSPTDAGATGAGGDIAVDLAGATFGFLQHEVGHVLGFQHAFGPFIPPPSQFGSLYNDPYDVMGYTGTYARPATPPASIPASAAPRFSTSERPVSGASLWRHLDAFTWSRRAVDLPLDGFGRGSLRIHGLCTPGGSTPQVGVVVVPGQPGQVLTVEYRPDVEDDAGVVPGVVVHTLGVHPVAPGQSEDRPAWFEGRLDAAAGARLAVPDARLAVTVTGVNPGVHVDVEVSRLPIGL